MKLVVTSAFGNYLPGNEITDPDKMKEVLAERPSSVVKVPDAPAEDAPADTPPADTPPADTPPADTALLSLPLSSKGPAKAFGKSGT